MASAKSEPPMASESATGRELRSRPERANELPTTLYRLRCFQTVVEEGGIKRATVRLHITQPALSYQIKQMEEEMGSQLFYRGPGGMRPTEAGRLLYRHAQEIGAQVRQAERAVRELSEGAKGEVRIGTVNSVGIYFLPRLLFAFRKRYPAAHPTVFYRESDDIVSTLLADQLDLAVLADPRPEKRLRYETLFEERVAFVCGRTHPFFGRPTVKVDQLADTRFVALSAQTPTGALIAGHLERLGLAVDPVVESENVETVKRMVALGMGVAFLPAMVIERDETGSACEGRLWSCALDPPLLRRIVLVTWNEPRTSRAVDAFIDQARGFGAAWRAERRGA